MPSRQFPAGDSGAGHARAVSNAQSQAGNRRQDMPSLPALSCGSPDRNAGYIQSATSPATILRKCNARFSDLGPGYYASRIDKEKKTRGHVRQLEALGYTVTLAAAA